MTSSSSAPDGNALNFVRRALAERRHSRLSSGPTPTSLDGASPSSRPPPLSPSPAVCKSGAADVDLLATSGDMARMQRDGLYGESWTWWSATAARADSAADGGAAGARRSSSSSSSAPTDASSAAGMAAAPSHAASMSAPLPPRAPPSASFAASAHGAAKTSAAAPPRRISYYAGFLPDTLDREERVGATPPSPSRASVVEVPPTRSRAGSSSRASTATADFVSGSHGPRRSTATGSSSSARGRRSTRATISAEFVAAAVASGAASSSASGGVSRHTSQIGVTYDAALASAMVSTAQRMKAHQQGEQQRRRSSVWSGDEAPSLSTATQHERRSVAGGSRNSSRESVQRVLRSPPDGLFSTEAARMPFASTGPVEGMRSESGEFNNPRSSDYDLTGDRPEELSQALNRSAPPPRASLVKPSTPSATTAELLPRQRRSEPAFSFSHTRGSGGAETSALCADRDRAATWANGMLLPVLPLPSSETATSTRMKCTTHPGTPTLSVVSPSHVTTLPVPASSQPDASQVQSEFETPAAAATTKTRVSFDHSGRPRSSFGSGGSDALTAYSGSVKKAHSVPARVNAGSGGSTVVPGKGKGADDAAQLSHHQLTEAFYGSHKGGQMARDAYLFFISQQQQQQGPQQQQRRKSSQKRQGKKASLSGAASASSASSVAPTQRRGTASSRSPVPDVRNSISNNDRKSREQQGNAVTTDDKRGGSVGKGHGNGSKNAVGDAQRPSSSSSFFSVAPNSTVDSMRREKRETKTTRGNLLRGLSSTPPVAHPENACGSSEHVEEAPVSTPPSAQADGNASNRLDALWRRSELIFKQKQQQHQ